MPTNGNGSESDQSEPGMSLQETADTTKALLEASLDAGVPAPEALEASRPQSWSN